MDITSPTSSTFTPGQIVGIDCRFFRGIRHLRILAGPHINYFVAPNGMGKTSILYAIAICLGSEEVYSRHKNTLIYDKESEASITLALCATPNLSILEAHRRFEDSVDSVTTASSLFIPGLTVIQVRLRANQREYFLDGNSFTVEQVRTKIADAYSIRIDNPFQAMMQVNAQRLASMTPDRRFQAFVQFALADVGSGIEQLQDQITSCRKQFSEFASFREDIFDNALEKFKGIDKQWQTTQNRQRLNQVIRNCQELGYLIKAFKDGQSHENLRQELNELSIQMRDCEANEADTKRMFEDAKAVERELETTIVREMVQPQQFLRSLEDDSSTIYKLSPILAEQMRQYRIGLDRLNSQGEATRDRAIESRRRQKEKIEKLKAETEQLTKRKSEIDTLIDGIRRSQAFGTESVRIQELQREIQKLQGQCEEHKNFINKLSIHGIRGWIEHVQNNITPEEGVITFAPIVQYFGIVSDPLIPRNILRRVVQKLVGKNLFAVLTSSLDLSKKLTESFERCSKIGAVSDVITFNLEQMTLEEYEARSQRVWEDAFRNTTLNMTNISSFQPGDVISINQSITGRYSVLRELLSTFKGVYYLKLRQERAHLRDIEFLFQQNPQSVRIVFTDTTIYKAHAYMNQFAGVSIAHHQSQDERSILIESIDKPPALLCELEAKIKNLEQEKSEEERRSKEKSSDIRYRELKEDLEAIHTRMNEIRHEMRQAEKQLAADENSLNGTEALRTTLEITKQKINDIRKEIICNILKFLEQGRRNYRHLRKISPHIDQYQSAKHTAGKHSRQYDAAHEAVCKVKRRQQSKLESCNSLWNALRNQLGNIADSYQLNVTLPANTTESFDLSPLEARRDAILNNQDFKCELDQFRRERSEFKETSIENCLDNFQSWVKEQIPKGPLRGVTNEAYTEHRGKLRDAICEVLSKIISLVKKLRDTAKQIVLISRRAETLITSASARFRENMERFGVAGDLRLTGVPGEQGFQAIDSARLWIEKALEDPLEFIQLDQFQYFLTVTQWTGDFDEAVVGLRRALLQMCTCNTTSIKQYIDETFQGSSIQALAKTIPHRNTDIHINVLIKECENIAPGMRVDTEFARGERLRDISLSGGERSVVSLCIVNSLRGENAFDMIPFRLVDEINQGLDDTFEQAAHEMLCSTSELQYFISSPKLPSYLRFDRNEILVHVLMRPPVPSDFLELYPGPVDTII